MLWELNKLGAYLVASLISILGLLALISSGSLIALPLLFLGPTLAILIHELGHAWAAWSLGMAVREIAVGPFFVRFRPTRFGFSGQILGDDVGGRVVHDESRGRYLTRSTDALIISAGPLANLATAGIALAVGRYIPDEAMRGLVVGFGLTSLATFVLSAWPLKFESGRGNDALELFRALRGRSRETIERAGSGRSPWQAP